MFWPFSCQNYFEANLDILHISIYQGSNKTDFIDNSEAFFTFYLDGWLSCRETICLKLLCSVLVFYLEVNMMLNLCC